MAPKPPVITHQWAQGGKQETKELKRIHEELLKTRRPGNAQQFVVFTADSGNSVEAVEVLCSDGNAITVTDGWPKYAHVTRHGRVALTVHEGYEPLTVTIPIMFDAVAVTKNRQHVESQIALLEWMAGRGPKREAELGGEIIGEPPLVQISCTDANGVPKNLIPKQFQGISGPNEQLWYIGTLTLDAASLRDAGGERLRQTGTVTLTEFIASPTVQAAQLKARESAKNKFLVRHTTAAYRTVLELLKHLKIHASTANVKAVLAANPKIHHPEKNLPLHTAVRIPKTIFHPVAKG